MRTNMHACMQNSLHTLRHMFNMQRGYENIPAVEIYYIVTHAVTREVCQYHSS